MMKIPSILVTGANGQLGKELQELAPWFHYHFLFAGRDELPLEDFDGLRRFFLENKPDYCINCAAYTAVDKAESEREQAFKINGEAVGELARLCSEFRVKLIHISTDYVYDGSAQEPLREDADLKPLNVYGESKLKGEELALQNKDAVVIRTSWVYSSYGSNFVKTMLRLMNSRDEINVVSDQWGSPTYARDLAEAIMIAIEELEKGAEVRGIFNFSNRGVTNWQEFAVEIKKMTDANCKINSIKTADYQTPAQRPLYSVMNTSKIQKALGIQVPDWKESLARMLEVTLSRTAASAV